MDSDSHSNRTLFPRLDMKKTGVHSRIQLILKLAYSVSFLFYMGITIVHYNIHCVAVCSCSCLLVFHLLAHAAAAAIRDPIKDATLEKKILRF